MASLGSQEEVRPNGDRQNGREQDKRAEIVLACQCTDTRTLAT